MYLLNIALIEMAYKRKRSIRKRTGKKRMPKRRYAMYRNPRWNSNFMHVCMKTRDTLVANSNLAEQYETYRFSLAACLNASTYAAMWDQYRINKVVITWKPIRVQSVVSQVENVTPGSTTNIPSYVTAIDNDDLSPVSYADTKTRYGSVEKLATQSHKLVLKPAVLSEIYQSTISTAYSPNYGKWIDTANETVPHYGVRLAMEQAEPLGNYALECRTKIYISFKNRVL